MAGRFKLIPTSHLVLIKDGKVLLARRVNTGFADGSYGVVAGHLDGGETFLQAMVREAREEAGIGLDASALEVVHVMHRKAGSDERIDFFIKAVEWVGEPRIMEPGKCDGMAWFGLDSLPGNTVPYVRQALESIRKNEFYGEFGW